MAGGLAFPAVKAGNFHTCGVTTSNITYSWGYNGEGQLGIGTADLNPHPRPVRVAGGFAFGFVSTNDDSHTCGLTATKVAYCWGSNFGGELGDGTSGNIRTRPVAVVSP